MSVTTSTSTSSSGSTTTVGATVRNEGGGGGDVHKIDVFLSLDASKLKHDADGSPDPAATAHSEASLMCWWKDRTVNIDEELAFQYKVKWISSVPLFDTATGFVIIFDRSTDEVYYHDIAFSRTPRLMLSPFLKGASKLDVLKKKGLPRPKSPSKLK